MRKEEKKDGIRVRFPEKKLKFRLNEKIQVYDIDFYIIGGLIISIKESHNRRQKFSIDS